MFDEGKFHTHIFEYEVGDGFITSGTLLLDPAADTIGTQSLLVEMKKLEFVFDQFKIRKAHIDDLDHQCDVIIQHLDDPNIDINAYEVLLLSELDRRIVPFFFKAFSHAPFPVLDAFVKQSKLDLSRTRFDNDKEVTLLGHMAEYDEGLFALSPALVDSFNTLERYRLACSIPEQPVFRHYSEGLDLSKVLPRPSSPHSGFLQQFVNDRFGWIGFTHVEKIIAALREFDVQFSAVQILGLSSEDRKRVHNEAFVATFEAIDGNIIYLGERGICLDAERLRKGRERVQAIEIKACTEAIARHYMKSITERLFNEGSVSQAVRKRVSGGIETAINRVAEFHFK